MSSKINAFITQSFSLNKYETLIIAIPVPDERKCHMGPKFKLGFFLQKIRQIDGEDLEYLATQFHDFFFSYSVTLNIFCYIAIRNSLGHPVHSNAGLGQKRMRLCNTTR